jgi:glycerol-3-phosphate dehydrogenase
MVNNTIIVGGGLFGLTTAIILGEQGLQVTVLEKNLDVLKEASLVNQNRIHYGYHYPRSIETGKESIEGMKAFKSYYQDCIYDSFVKYYAISKYNSHINAHEFIQFCEQLNISLTEEWPNESLLTRSQIEQCWRVYEPAFDYQTLRVNVMTRLQKLRNVRILRNAQISKIENVHDDLIQVTLNNNYQLTAKNLINAAYSGLGDVLKLAFKQDLQAKFQLLVLPILKLEKKMPAYGVTIMDGPFCSILPKGFVEGEFILSHVKASVIESDKGLEKPQWNTFDGDVEHSIIEACTQFFPILKEMKWVDSWITTKMILPNQEIDDARPTLVLTHQKNIHSVFSGKVTTCVSAAQELLTKIII